MLYVDSLLAPFGRMNGRELTEWTGMGTESHTFSTFDFA